MSTEENESGGDWWNSSSAPNPISSDADTNARPDSSEVLLPSSRPVVTPDVPDHPLGGPVLVDTIPVSQPAAADPALTSSPHPGVPRSSYREPPQPSDLSSPHLNRNPSAYVALNNGPQPNSRSPSPYLSDAHHLHPSMIPKPNAHYGHTPHDPDFDPPEWSTYHHDHSHKKVDRNSFKRNMTIAKGFLDISLLSANANQLKNLLNFGDKSEASFYFIKTGLITSLILQLVTGMLLILLERWNINKPHHAVWSLRLNNTIVCLVFLTLVINVIVSSFGVDVMMHTEPQQIPGSILGRSVNGSFRIRP